MHRCSRLLPLLLVASVLFTAHARNVFDIPASAPVIDCFACIKGQGYDTVIVEAQAAGGFVSVTMVENIQAAKSNGLSVEVAIFPNVEAPITSQLAETLGYLQQTLSSFDALWVEVSNTTYWASNSSTNQQFLAQFVLQSVNYVYITKIGIQTNLQDWVAITNNCTTYMDFPLWWVQYDGLKNYNAFVPFGGWELPSLKQYTPQQTVCCADANLDW